VAWGDVVLGGPEGGALLVEKEAIGDAEDSRRDWERSVRLKRIIFFINDDFVNGSN